MSAQIKHLTVEHVDPRGGVTERIIDRAFDLAQAILADPSLLDRIPDGAAVAFVPDADPEVAEASTQLANSYARRGRQVVLQPVHVTGTAYHFTIDLRDETWGAEPRPEFNGKTAAEMRAIFAEIVKESQEQGPVGMKYENIVVLNGVRITIEEEMEPGLYRCIAVDRKPS